MSPILKDGTYFIINKKSNTAFDLSVQDQRAIIGYCRNGGANQKWRVRKHHDCDGSWTIQSVYNSRYLDVDIPNVYSDGVRVVAIDTQQPRKWDIRYDDQFHGWRIFYHGTNANVDLSDNGNPANFTPITLWGQWAGEHQVWCLENAC